MMKFISVLWLTILLTGCTSHVSQNSSPDTISRIAVVLDDNNGKQSLPQFSNQIVQLVSSHLTRYHFDVVNTHAFEEVNKDAIKQFTFNDHKNLCETYGTDAIMVVSLDVEKKEMLEPYCIVQLSIQAWGYDAGGMDLGIAVHKTIRLSDDSCRGAAKRVIKELAYIASRDIAGLLIAKNEG